MKVQSQIRQNAEEMSHYLSDLNSWSTTQVKKDQALLSKKPKQRGIRTTSTPTPISSSENEIAYSSSQPVPRPNGEVLTPASLVSQHSIPVIAPAAVPKATGDVSLGQMESKGREEGNSEYQKGHFLEAIKLYTKCIGLKVLSLQSLYRIIYAVICII